MKPETRQEMVNQLRKERGDRPLHKALQNTGQNTQNVVLIRANQR